MSMSVRDYNSKIKRYNTVNTKIDEANAKYEEAITELQKNVGVVKCEELETKIRNKIYSLKKLKRELNGKIADCKDAIAKLEREEKAKSTANKK